MPENPIHFNFPTAEDPTSTMALSLLELLCYDFSRLTDFDINAAQNQMRQNRLRPLKELRVLNDERVLRIFRNITPF